MKAAEIRSKTDEELQATATELREKLFRLRMQLYTGQLEKPGSIKQTRRTIARVETVLTERAHVAANEGRFDEAARHLQNLATHLLSQGETSIAKTAMLEAQSLENMRAWSESGSKDIKYKTRALLLGSGMEKKL